MAVTDYAVVLRALKKHILRDLRRQLAADGFVGPQKLQTTRDWLLIEAEFLSARTIRELKMAAISAGVTQEGWLRLLETYLEAMFTRQSRWVDLQRGRPGFEWLEDQND
jgi:hypothetical protein